MTENTLEGWARIIEKMGAGYRPPKGVADRLSDTDAMDLIQRALSVESWSADTVDAIADYVRATGRTIGEDSNG